ncbi:hypothetical protein [Cupriavidus lacunae]|nr:hypothetical protein [Cupriavidus lacunae]
MRIDAERIAQAIALPGSEAYQEKLASVLDEWIRRGSTRQQLICLACAAEQGTLDLHALIIGRQALLNTQDAALHRLYWACVRRWRHARSTL